MNVETDSRFEELLRARTLGFHVPRPGTRPSPREYDDTSMGIPQVESVLDELGVAGAEVVAVERCVSRRRVWLARRADQSCVLLKWPDEDAELDNDYESVMLGVLRDLPLPDNARSAVPAILGGGTESRILALDALTDCVSLHELIKRDVAVPEHSMAGLATALSELHGVSIEEAYSAYPEWLLYPPIPKDTLVNVDEYVHGCGIEFDEYLRTMQALEPFFREIHDAWHPAGLVHFDLRDDNILFPIGPADAPVRIIDWELSGFADPLYDVGYVVGQLLLGWLRKQGTLTESDIAFAVARRNILSFLTAYRTRSGTSGEAMIRVFQYAGIALLIHSSVRLQQLGALGKIGHVALLLGRRFVQDPDHVARLLGGPSKGIPT